jgi:hypothetical protein
MSGSRFHTIVGALFKQPPDEPPIEYGIIEVVEAARHQPVMVNPNWIGQFHAARHEAIMVNPGWIGSIKAARHESLMVNPAWIGGLEMSRHEWVNDAVAEDEWSIVVDATDRMDGFVTMNIPGLVFTDVEYSIDGGSWTSGGITSGTGTFVIPDVTGRTVRLRLLFGTDATPPSAAKLLSPMRLVQESGSTTATTYDAPAFTFDPAKHYLFLVSAFRTTAASITLTGNIGAAGRAPGAGTNLTALGSANSPNGGAPITAFVATGFSGSLTFRTTSNQTSTLFCVSMFELAPGFTTLANIQGVGTNSGTGDLTVSYTPTIGPPSVIFNHVAFRNALADFLTYTTVTGEEIQALAGEIKLPVSSAADQVGSNFFPTTRVLQRSANSNIVSNHSVSVRRAMLVAELN